MTIKEELDAQKQKCLALLGYICCICGCKHAKRGMTIHHVWYIKDDIVYSNYPQNDSGRLQYYKDLEPMIKKNPKRFRVMCNTDHQSLERLCRFGDEKFNKLSALRRVTLKYKHL